MKFGLLPCIGAILLCAATAVFSPSRAQTVKDDKTPIRPVIPNADRTDASRVFLEHANELMSKAGLDYQILVGDVQFRRAGMFMYCDSAHFYDQTGSFEAFGNVRMEQGDTLFVYADELNYNDSLQLAVLYSDYGKKVRLINREVTLKTDVFNYDLSIDLGYYEVGGELSDSQNVLTSIEGEYNPTTKEANFRQDVHLTSRNEQKDTLEIYTDDLYYNTSTHVAVLTTDSKVISADGTIYTTNGIYNTESTASELFDRSLVVASNGNTLTGDTLFYNRKTGFGEAFGNIEICDTANKVILQGQYGFYNELTDSALVTGQARAIEYSQGDSLYLHGDTIRAFRIIALPDTTTKTSKLPAKIVNPDLVFETPAPLLQPETTDSVGTKVEELTAKEVIKEVEAIVEDVFAQDKLVPDTLRYIIAAPHVKFYRKDMQGLCDSMTVVSRDTTLFMNYKPIVWSDNRQITGDVIEVHFNDSTIDWAKVPTNSFMAEKIEDGYYNQLSGKEMVAKFLDGRLHHLDVNGNVLAITFPEEEDSTINKVANVESSFLAADFKDNTIEKMKLWPATNASVTPLYLAKRSLMFLQAFKWLEEYRPTDPDDIFNFPDKLLDLFDDTRRNAGAPIPSRKPKEIPAETAITEESDTSTPQPDTENPDGES